MQGCDGKVGMVKCGRGAARGLGLRSLRNGRRSSVRSKCSPRNIGSITMPPMSLELRE